MVWKSTIPRTLIGTTGYRPLDYFTGRNFWATTWTLVGLLFGASILTADNLKNLISLPLIVSHMIVGGLGFWFIDAAGCFFLAKFAVDVIWPRISTHYWVKN
jgi:hypothetical protein